MKLSPLKKSLSFNKYTQLFIKFWSTGYFTAQPENLFPGKLDIGQIRVGLIKRERSEFVKRSRKTSKEKFANLYGEVLKLIKRSLPTYTEKFVCACSTGPDWLESEV